MSSRLNGSALKPMTLAPLAREPLVSVIMSSFNHRRFIDEAIDSVLRQTYQHVELIICDDGSTDGSRAAIAARLGDDDRVRAIFNENGGQASAWNAAFGASSGEIICFLDSDDAFVGTKLEQVVAAFQAHPSAGVVCHRLRVVDERGVTHGAPIPPDLDSGWLAERLLASGGRGAWAPSSGLSIRREIAERLFPLPLRFRKGSSDAHIQATAGFLTEVVVAPQSLSTYRIHGANGYADMAPSVASVETLIESFDDVLQELRSFVAAEFGAEVADRIRLEDIDNRWDQLRALYLLLGKPVLGVFGYPRNALLAHLPASRRRYIWRVLLSLPAPLGQRLLRFWWGISPIKHVTRPITGRLGLR